MEPILPITRLLSTDVGDTLPLNTTASGPVVVFVMPPVGAVPPPLVSEPVFVQVVEPAV